MSRNTSAVTVHGITRDETKGGIDEPEALRRFLDYLQDGVIVGHHINHDISTLNAGYQRHWGVELMNRSLDTMDLTLHLEKSGAFEGGEPIREFTLDSLCARFGIIPHDRHTAGGDAFITAQIFQRLVRLASRHGREQLGALCEPFPHEESA
jgi:DNA polymerase-3 subunit epsilon